MKMVGSVSSTHVLGTINNSIWHTVGGILIMVTTHYPTDIIKMNLQT
jgi:hypothetical protein